MQDKDPNGLDQHDSGAKLDEGKPRVALVLGSFSRALLEVSKVGTDGAIEYSDNGWKEVPNGIERYDDAMLRHWLAKAKVAIDKKSGFLHLAHMAWNVLAVLELTLLEDEVEKAITKWENILLSTQKQQEQTSEEELDPFTSLPCPQEEKPSAGDSPSTQLQEKYRFQAPKKQKSVDVSTVDR